MATSSILFLYWKILGVFPFNIAEDGVVRVSYGRTFYGLFLSVVYSYYYIRAVTSQMTFVLPHKTPMSVIANFSGLSIEYASLVSAWLYFGLRPRQLHRILVFLKNINESFADHGMRTADIKLFREVKIHTTILNIVWYLICAISYQLLLHFEPYKLTVWMPLLILRVVSHNIVLIFVDAMRLINKRFRLLNDTILCLPNEETRIKNVRRKNREGRTRNGGLQLFVTPRPLEVYGQLHAKLVNLVTIVVEFFSLSILFAILFQIIQMAGTFYTLCVIAQDETLSPWAFVWIYWVAIHVVELIILVFVCDSTVKEVSDSSANRTGSVLHGMLITGSTDEYLDSAKVLSLQLLQKQLQIKVYGLFEIRHVIINKITGMVIVYITIMMQLDSQSAAEM